MNALNNPRQLPGIAAAAVLAISGVLFVATHFLGTNHQSFFAWILSSWPTLVALAVGLFLLEAGPLRSWPPALRKLTALIRYIICFLACFAVLPLLGLPKIALTTIALMGTGVFFFFAVFKLGGILGFPRLMRRGTTPKNVPPGTSSMEDGLQTKTPTVRFRDLGGLEAAKQQILQLANTRLNAKHFAKAGIVQNGILLYGMQGTGKTLLAEATAGELGLNYIYVSGVALNGMWIGETGNNIRRVFRQAAHGRTLLFLDEIDAIGGARAKQPGRSSATREFNNTTTQLMQCIDQYRREPGLLIMAATNSLDSLDPALIREGRFDVKIRLDLPAEPERADILTALLNKRGVHFPIDSWARATSGYSPAKLNALVDRAAALAVAADEPFLEKHLEAAFETSGGKDRPLIQPVQWEDLIVESVVEDELRLLVRQLKIRSGSPVPVPTGVLLAGPPGTGKTMIARLLATQSARSFYPVTAADVLGSGQGDSVKRLAELFARAKEHSPSIIFFDELDGLFGSTHTFASSHDTQFTEQALIEISRIEASHQVLLVGATNHPDRLDSRILRGGRFSEKIEIGVPGPANRERLLRKLLTNPELALPISLLVEKTAGMAPADIEAIVHAARRFAFGRSDGDDRLPPLEASDFDRAIDRVNPARYAEPPGRNRVSA